MNFDPEQTEAIHLTGENILVRASAGAGKTGVLVARLLKRITADHIPLSRILAVTFTAAAASEMKKRLASGLNERLSTETDPAQRNWLEEQLVLLENTQITTIDSYCLSIIQKYSNVIGLDPSTSTHILSSGKDEMYKRNAFHQALAEMDQQDHEALLALCEFISSRPEDYDSLYDVCWKIISCAETQESPDEWIKTASHSYDAVSSFDAFPENVRSDFFNYFKIHCQIVCRQLEEMEKLSHDIDKINTDKIIEKENLAVPCLHALGEHNYPQFIQFLDQLVMKDCPAGTKYPEYNAIYKSMDESIKEMASMRFDPSVFVKNDGRLEGICCSLCTLSINTMHAFTALKQKDACMDFNDMERYALNILNANHGETAAIIRDSLDEIMIDEFQDTSQLQNLIIEKIAKENNVFRVGDVKQSIYRFRQAKPQLMRSLIKDGTSHVITLKHNYRSKDSIVRFTNLLFEKIMNIEGCQDTYSSEDHVTINSKHQEESEPVPVVFAAIEKEPDNTTDYKELKASWIARKILDEKKKNPELHYRDFAVLLRGHADKAWLRTAFERCGIPYDIDAREGFYQSSLCQTILSLCRVMVDNTDEVSLLSLLTSSFYGFTDEQLVEMKKKAGTISKGVHVLYPQVRKDLQELKAIEEKNGIAAMLSKIACMHDFFESLDSREQANFDYLFEMTAAENPSSLTEFIDGITQSEDEKSSEAMSKGKDDDVVTVTTIHHSKGLQYPYVFLWSSSQNAFHDSADPVMVDEELGIGLKEVILPYRARRMTMRRIALEQKADLEDLEEFTRLLYVAVTRAESRLYIVDSFKKEWPHADADLPLLEQRKGMSGLILSVMEDGPLFQVIKYKPDIISPSAASSAKENVTLPHWKLGTSVLGESLTPSSTEVKTLPELDLEENGSTAYGTRMHEALENMPFGPWSMDDIKDSTLSNADKERILAFGNSDLYKKACTMTMYHEYPFYIEQNGTRMHGVMDFVAVGEKDIILIDYKTDNASCETIINRYYDQLNAYRSVLKKAYPDKVIHAWAWSLHNNCAIAVPEKE